MLPGKVNQCVTKRIDWSDAMTSRHLSKAAVVRTGAKGAFVVSTVKPYGIWLLTVPGEHGGKRSHGKTFCSRSMVARPIVRGRAAGIGSSSRALSPPSAIAAS